MAPDHTWVSGRELFYLWSPASPGGNHTRVGGAETGNIWFIAAGWMMLALLASIISIRLGISVALIEW
jgi:hypothetical protein